MCQAIRSQVKNLPTGFTSAALSLAGEHSHVLPPATHRNCVQVTASPLHNLPGRSIITALVIPSAIPSCSGGTNTPEPFLQCPALPCKGEGRRLLQNPAGGNSCPSPASEESCSLGKSSGRVITGCIQTDCRDIPAQEVTVGSCAPPVEHSMSHGSTYTRTSRPSSPLGHRKLQHG